MNVSGSIIFFSVKQHLLLAAQSQLMFFRNQVCRLGLIWILNSCTIIWCSGRHVVTFWTGLGFDPQSEQLLLNWTIFGYCHTSQCTPELLNNVVRPVMLQTLWTINQKSTVYCCMLLSVDTMSSYPPQSLSEFPITSPSLLCLLHSPNEPHKTKKKKKTPQIRIMVDKNHQKQCQKLSAPMWVTEQFFC
jgi:hypothetical protein